MAAPEAHERVWIGVALGVQGMVLLEERAGLGGDTLSAAGTPPGFPLSVGSPVRRSSSVGRCCAFIAERASPPNPALDDLAEQIAARSVDRFNACCFHLKVNPAARIEAVVGVALGVLGLVLRGGRAGLGGDTLSAAGTPPGFPLSVGSPVKRSSSVGRCCAFIAERVPPPNPTLIDLAEQIAARSVDRFNACFFHFKVNPAARIEAAVGVALGVLGLVLRGERAGLGGDTLSAAGTPPGFPLSVGSPVKRSSSVGRCCAFIAERVPPPNPALGEIAERIAA